MKPRNPYYLCYYGMLLFMKNRLSEAREFLEKALAVTPSYALARYQLGWLLTRLDLYEQARPELEKAVAIQPDLHEAYYVLARTYHKLGEEEKSKSTMATYLRYRKVEDDERQQILRQLQRTIQEEIQSPHTP